MGSKASVLVAVENEVARRILEAQLDGWGCTARSAVSGQQAWEILCDDGETSVLVADRAMRLSDGRDLCRCARSLVRRRYLHIILLTTRGGAQEELLDVVDLGADAILATPHHPSELQAQIRIAERIITLEDRLSDRLEELTEIHKRIREDLRAAAHMQKALLPKDEPDIPGARFAWRYEACEQVAGDMFNVIRLDENRIGLYVLDVCGHGVQAALISVTLSRMLSPLPQSGGLLKRPIAAPPFYEIVPPRDVARECNRLYPHLGDTSFFFTLLYGILDISKRKFTFIRAGHPGPIHVGADGATVIQNHHGIAIGIEPGADFPEETLHLKPGDKVILLSDGIEEALSPAREEFGVDRLTDVLTGKQDSSIAGAVDAVWKTMREFMGNEPRHDDMTLLGFEIL